MVRSRWNEVHSIMAHHEASSITLLLLLFDLTLVCKFLSFHVMAHLLFFIFLTFYIIL